MGSSKPTPVETKQNTVSEPWSRQIPYLAGGDAGGDVGQIASSDSLFGQARNLAQNPMQFYGGQTFADPSQSTLQGLAGTEARAMQGSPALMAAQDEATKSLRGDYLMAENPYFSKMAENVTANVLPGLDSRYMAAGRTGSGLHGRAVGEGLGSAIGSLAYQNYGDERNRMGQYAGMAPQLAAADYLDPQMMMQAGAQREAIAQQPITEAMARHDFSQSEPWQRAAQYQGLITGNYGGTQNTTGTQYMQQQNPWMQALGAVAGAAGTGLGIWAKSDVRAKENIERVGTFDDTGLPIYRYNYKGQQAPMFGPMAQEVLKVKPEAVAMLPDGYLGVDYLQVS
jgi:hypothetical protein